MASWNWRKFSSPLPSAGTTVGFDDQVRIFRTQVRSG